jgi:2-polyprenyl-3-methyl-5-hydroxy-6-metoxy-1,4-benzoquinol methylase
MACAYGLTPHGVLPDIAHDEEARERFVFSFKQKLLGELTPANRTVFEKEAEPAFRRRHGRAPRDKNDVAEVMERQPSWQMFSSLHRTSQELMWETCIERCERQGEALEERARRLATSNRRKGSLRLDPNLKLPRYIDSLDTHVQPGGYYAQRGTGFDVHQAAVYDTGVHLYFVGGMGAMSDDMGLSGVAYLKRKFPGLRPRRILDMGCSIGHSTLPYCEAFPESEIHAIDVGAPLLRYGHARAESLGKEVHFSQQNAERTDFPDGHFDLVMSHILFHETSARAMPLILRECRRLLSPGGVMMHLEVPAFDFELPTAYDRFQRDWPGRYNAEPFWSTLHEMDPRQMAIDAGFDAQTTKIDHAARPHDNSSTFGARAFEWFALVGRG